MGWRSGPSISPAGAMRQTAATSCSPLATPKPGAGAFGAAQETFVSAAEVARKLGAADKLARTALGYGGRYVWFRAGKDRRLIPLLEDALEAQPTGDAGMRAMLLARLAGAPRGQPVPERRAALTDEAVEIARRLGDPQTLAYALEGTYASICWPRETDRWLSMAAELCQIGEQLGDMEKAFSGHLHAFGAFMVRGDLEAADLEFATVTAIAHQLRQPLQLWALTSAGVMRAMRVGRFDEAEELLERELSLGSGGQRGLTDDTTFQYVSHFHEWALRRERGRVVEVRGSLERFVAEYPAFFVFRCMLVSTYSEAGEQDKARVELGTLAADDFRGLEVGTEWFFGASLLAEACERLDEPAHALPLYQALLPYDDYVVITHPEINLGSAARYLGLLASVMGRAEDAVRHFERALEANERMASRPWSARTQADLARTLLARRAPGDAHRASELSRSALQTFDALGMNDPAERLRDAVGERS
jgi:tetratricopeptide (TPR) repeat protein